MRSVGEPNLRRSQTYHEVANFYTHVRNAVLANHTYNKRFDIIQILFRRTNVH